MSVKPLKRGYTPRGVCFVTEDDIVTPDGELHPRSELVPIFASQTDIIRFVVRDPGHCAWELCQAFSGTPNFNFTATETLKMAGYSRRGQEILKYESAVQRIGWTQVGRNLERSRYHEMVNIESLFGKIIGPTDLPLIMDKYHDLEDYCRERNLPVPNSRGHMGRTVLRMPAHYSRERRKVPRATNDTIRKYGLDGNHYSLPLGGEGVTHSEVIEYDLNRAHPTMGATMDLPDSDSFYATGHYMEALSENRRLWLTPESKHWSNVMDEGKYKGAHLLAVQYPDSPTKYDGLTPPWADVDMARDSKRYVAYDDKRDCHVIMVFSNELMWLDMAELTVLGSYCAWLSPVTDEGMKRASRWIISELDAASEFRRAWLKPMLLATYGGLACTPKANRFTFHHASSRRAEPRQIMLSSRGLPPVEGYLVGSDNITEPHTNHVAQRAMIEAETRNHTLALAIQLCSSGMVPIHIYADCVYALPVSGVMEPPTGWKVKHHTNFKSVHLHGVVSDQTVKLPGVSHASRKASEQRPTRSGWEGRKNLSCMFAGESDRLLESDQSITSREVPQCPQSPPLTTPQRSGSTLSPPASSVATQMSFPSCSPSRTISPSER